MHLPLRTLAAAAVLCACNLAAAQGAAPPAAYPWLSSYDAAQRLEQRFPPPAGYARRPAPPGSYTAWARGLPLLPGRPPVLLHDGRRKGNQSAHAAVLDIDVGRRDLQQCADALIRLRAEYLWAQGRAQEVEFRFTSGHPARWRDWRRGLRPRVHGNRVTWGPGGRSGRSHAAFRAYLDGVFLYAGSASLARDLEPLDDPQALQPGDALVQGGFPGHAVTVLDRAESASGDAVVLLAQSYMPAQQIHILRNATRPELGAWVRLADFGEVLQTPEWRFDRRHLRRWPERRK